VRLDERIVEYADRGWKAFIPMKDGRPFLDYTICTLRKAGFREVCIVLGPEHEEVMRYYREVDERLPDMSISFAIQERPLGTADAVYSARSFVGGDSFIVLNGDNLYPGDAVELLRRQEEEICYVVGFERESLISGSNFDADRIRSFSVMEVDDDWNLVRIIEKPEDPEMYRTRRGVLVNMNLWRFTPDIFWACERVKPHPVRGEYELTAAVQLLIDAGRKPVKVIPVRAGVLDLTYRADIPEVMRRLKEFQLNF